MPSVSHRPARYGTAEVALILGAPDWRVKNFALPAYGLEPTVKAAGRGSRRYYGWEAVLRLAVANELYEAFFSPDGIKGAEAAIANDKAITKWTASYDESGNAQPLVLTLSGRTNEETGTWERVWKVVDGKRAANEAEQFSELGTTVVSLDLVQLWENVVQRITELEGDGKSERRRSVYLEKRGKIWWYEFRFEGKRYRRSSGCQQQE